MKDCYKQNIRFLSSLSILAGFCFLLLAGNVEAQVLFSNPINGTNPSSMNPFLNGQTVADNMSANGIGRGSGVTAVNSTNSYALKKWQSSSLSSTKYFEFTMTPDAGYQLNFYSFVYNGTISAGSARYAFRSSLDNFSTDIGSPSSSGVIDLNWGPYQNISSGITFRLYCWGVSNNNVVISINDFQFTGSVSSTIPVLPEITSEPESGSYCQYSGSGAISVSATAGSGRISSYQWYVNTTDSNTGGRTIAGANSSSYTLPLETPGTSYYYCVVTNSNRQSVSSRTAAITVVLRPSGNFAYRSEGFCNAVTVPEEIASSTLVGAGTFSSSSGLSINTSSGAINPSLSTPGAYTVTFTVPAKDGCVAYSTTSSVRIDGKGTGTISYPTSVLCKSQTTPVAPIITGSGGSGASTWVLGSPGGLAMPGTGIITPSSSDPGTYTVTYYRAASAYCPEYSSSTTISITSATASISSSTPGERCGPGTVELKATASAGTVKWYNQATGGTLLGSGNSYTTPAINTTTTYYAEANNGGCTAASRTAVTATIKSAPSITVTTPGSRCGTGTVLLGASSSGTVIWYAAASGGSSLASGTSFTSPSISTNTTYYAEAVAAQCTSSTRAAVLATVNTIPSITETTNGSICGSGTVQLQAKASEGTVMWYNGSTGGSSLATGNSYTTPSLSANRTYYAEASSNGCKSTSRASVEATVVSLPTVTSVQPAERCGSGTVQLSATTSAGSVIWYNGSTGGTPIFTGNTFTTPSLSSNKTYYAAASFNNCNSSSRTAVTASIVSPPTVTSTTPSSSCGSGEKTISARASAGDIKWYAAATGGTTLFTGNSFTTPALNSSTTYYAEADNRGCTSARSAVAVTILSVPAFAIELDYCSDGGLVVLTATNGFSSYRWNTGASTQIIRVDQAGFYSVSANSPAGCAVEASISVAEELVINGHFTAGNTNFSTQYVYKADLPGVNNEMMPEGTYAIVPDAHNVHPDFYGRSRKGEGGNIMVINGSPDVDATVWRQNNTPVLPNTTYYFSAWAMSVVNLNNAVLQFSINGIQVGTIAYLPNGYTSNNGPYNWVRFYGQWNSGSSTSANLSIVNLNTVRGGNDFALDEISFGTLSPVQLSVNPTSSGICMDGALVLNTNAIGGASPFTYSWTGPNGFSSSQANPTVTSRLAATHNGSYRVTVRDALGCSVSQSINITAANLPQDLSFTAALSNVCTGASTNIRIPNSEAGVSYQLKNGTTGELTGTEVQGTGAQIELPTGEITVATRFKVIATRYSSGCARELSPEATVNVTEKPVIVITNQAVCSGTVNLTAAAVTAGSTGSGTLSYWTNAAVTTPLSNPTSISTSGIYYIKSTNGTCFDIQPVTVSIKANPTASFSYPGGPFCSSAANPQAVLSGTSIAGIFSSTSGLVFANTATGLVDLMASTPGTYTVTNTVRPSGTCPAVTATSNITITAAPNPKFRYVSNGLCQSPDASAELPVFEAGATAGTFSSSNGLVFQSTSTGAINVKSSTPGNYAVINKINASGGCQAASDTFYLRINPYTFEGAVFASSSVDQLCEGASFNLFSSGSSYQTVLLREDFENSAMNWSTGNSSTGGTPANAAWTIRADKYSHDGNTFRSNDQSKFYLSSSFAQGSGSTTNTVLKSPQLNTIGFSSLSLDFFHYFRFSNSGDIAKVQVSVNNMTWTDVAIFNSNKGSAGSFANEVVNLNAYTGLPTLYIRFVYSATYDKYWAIDNISVTGASTKYTYSWNSSPSGFSSSEQNPVATAESSRFYVVTAMNNYGCKVSAIPVPVTVNPIPENNAGTDKDICGAGSIQIGKTSKSGRTYLWTPATGLNDPTLSEPIANPSSTTSYSLLETNTQTGCSARNEIVVRRNEAPVIVSSVAGSRCGTGTVTLEAVSSTGTVKWYAAASGGAVLATGNSFTTPSISADKTYYADPSAGGCPAASRTPVEAIIASAPLITSQSMAAASYSQSAPANPLSINVNPKSGTIQSYQWYSNNTASNNGGSEIPGADTASYYPPTDVVGTKYYYCVSTNSFGCSVKSPVSGAITTLLSPVITSVIPTLPLVVNQNNNTGYRGQRITINGSNFQANSTVKFNGVNASSVIFVNSTQLTAVVNNTGQSASGTVMVTNPSNNAFGTAAFDFIGYLTAVPGAWVTTTSWYGGSLPLAGSDVTITNAQVLATALTTTLNKLNILPGGTLTFSTNASSLSASLIFNQGSMIWTGSGTLTVTESMNLSAESVFIPGTGTVKYTKTGEQHLFTGKQSLDFYNLSLEGSGEKILGDRDEIGVNNITVKDGTSLKLGQSSQKIKILGNFTIDGSMQEGNSIFEFNGLADQEFKQSSRDTISISALRINKLSGSLVLKNSVQVRDSLIMSKGNIKTGTNLLTVGESPEERGTINYSAGMIAGKLRRWYANAINPGINSGIFPMGQIINGFWRSRNVQLNYTNAPTEGGHITIEYIAEPMVKNLGTQWYIEPGSTGGAGFTITNFSNEGYWKIDNEAGKLIDGEYTISLSGEGYLLPAGLVEVTMVKRVNGGDWFCPGQHLPVRGSSDFPIISRSNVSGFSNFGYAGGAGNALPVSLISFAGECEDGKIKLNWSTASETNNHQFIVEESEDGENWEVVNTTNGSGNSTTVKRYSATKSALSGGEAYYRLTQVDFNGVSETFDPVFISCQKKQANEMKIYPNPATDWVNVDIEMSQPAAVQLAVFSSSGQLLMLEKANLVAGLNQLRLDISNIPQGAYHLNISSTLNLEFDGGRSIIKR